MPPDKVCKIIRQYNRYPISKEDMGKLTEIGEDYANVKNAVYRRYGGIGGLAKIYPGYTVQNEMTRSGLRGQLGMPSVYFYLAIFDALRDIKIQWAETKKTVLKHVNANQGMTEDEKHFLRYLLKVSNAFEAVLNRTPLNLPEELKQQYEALSSKVEVKKLENYLRRQVRKRPLKLHANTTDRFSVTERAYRYGDHGLYLSVKEKRKRIFIPLTDSNCYDRQLSVQLYPERGDMEIRLPIDVSVKKHDDYIRHVGLSTGMHTMLTTDEGHIYGEKLRGYQAGLSDWMRDQTSRYNQNRHANPGRKKYEDRKHKKEEQLHSYINQEFNRFLRTEKPQILYIPRFPSTGRAGPVKRINYHAASWQRGYIRRRLVQKCREQSVELKEVPAKDISNQCSWCGAPGQVKEGQFSCPDCQNRIDKKINAAKNARKRGEEQQRIIDHRNMELDKWG